jgi:hypothetical protein
MAAEKVLLSTARLNLNQSQAHPHVGYGFVVGRSRTSLTNDVGA